MRLKRRRDVEVPPKIKSFINGVLSTSLENIEEPLKGFVWEFDKGDFHHWVDLLNHFDTFFEKHIKPRKELQLEDNFLESDPPFPKESVLQILRVIRIVLENCTNKHFYGSNENHLFSLLSSADADVVEACLQTLAAFLKKNIGKYVIRDSSLSSKLFAFAQGWGGKEEGLGLLTCATEDGSELVAHELGSTLHYEFYNEKCNDMAAAEESAQGLQVIHLPDVNTCQESHLELLSNLVTTYKVPPSLRFSLFTRLRFAKAFNSLPSRQQFTCIRLYAFTVLVQACGATDDLVSFFNTEPEFINELVSLLCYEDAVPEKIRILSLLSLVALCQDRARQPSVLTAVTSGGHRGILSSLMQKAINSVISNSSKWSVVFAEALVSLVTVLVSSSSGCSAMREAGFIPTLLPLLKDTDPQHLHLVSMAVHVLEAFMDYSNPAAALFRDLGGLDDTIWRLKSEVSYVENITKEKINVSSEVDVLECSNSSLVVASTPSELDNAQPLYSEALVAYYRRLLMKALLRAISLGTYAPGSTTRIYGSEESLLPHCLCSIFKRARDFGGGVFSLAATVMSDLIHKDHTCFSVLEAAGLPSAFLAAIMDGVICSAEAITCIPQCLDALCLNINGLQAVRDHNALRCFVKIFTSRTYLRALSGDTPVTLSNGLDELMRHASSLRGLGVDMLIEILTDVAKIGSGGEVGTTLAESASSSNPVPMETDSEERNWVPSVGKEHSKVEKTEQSSDSGSDASKANFESFLPDCVTNVARLLETVLQSSDICRIFIEKKGIEAVLQLFSLPLMPPTVSIGHNIVVAFKNFSAQHSTSLARAVCSFLREQLVLTNELLVSVEGGLLSQVEASKRMKVLRLLSSLDGILLLLHSSLKGMTTGISELATADADVLKELGRVYRAIVWQISLCSDAKVNEKQNTVQEPESADASVFIAAERESDDDANTTEMRYMNPLSVRNSTHSQWGVGRDFLTVVRSSEGFTRRSRHGLARLRGGRMTGRSWMDTELLANISETFSQDMKKKSPDVLVSETLEKLASALRSFFTSLVKGFTSLNRRRTEPALLNSASKSIASALAKVFSMALRFSGYSDLASNAMPLSVKCRYFGKVVNDMAALTVDSRRHTCYAVMVNNFYAHGTLKEVLTTFEETSELLWRLPCSNSSSADHGKNTEGRKLSHSTWLLDTLQSYCRLLEHFVNSSLLLSLNPGSQAQLLVQPIAVGLSIGLFPIPKEPDAFVRMLQSQVLDVILPVWKHPMFPNCSSGFITTIISIVTYIYSGVGDVKRSPGAVSATNNQRFLAPPPDEANIATIVEMGFTRVRAEEALRRVETNSVEMAMEWLFSHVEDQVQDDDELAEALALSLGSPSEIAKASNDKPTDALIEEGHSKVSPIDDILAAAMNLFQSSDGIRFSVMDLLVTLCNRKKGQDCPKVTTYLVQQLKLCPLEFTKDVSTLSMVSHVLALLLSEDDSTREIAARNGVVSIAIDILMNFKASISSTCEVVASKSISSLLLILDNLLQFKLSIPTDYAEKIPSVPPIDVGNDASLLVSDADADKIIISEVHEKKSETAFEKTFGKSTGYLTLEESHSMLDMSCDLMKQHVPAVVMQAVLQLCARLTKTHSLALRFIENDGIVALFSLSRNCLFPGYDTLASAIVRHLLEDPQTLQAAMELEIRQTFTASRQGSRIPLRSFLTSMAPVISRDPEVFMKAAAAACQLELSGGLTVVVLSKEKEKEKPKASGVEIGASSTECVIVPEAKTHDTPSKCSKGYKKIPANLSQVIDHLIDIVLKYPLPNSEEIAAMEVDEPPALKLKGKSKMEETKKIEPDAQSERLAALAKVTFVLKLLSDILLMYVHAVGVILRRDSEMCQSRGSIHVEGPGHDGIVHHLLHRLLPLCVDGSDGPIEWNTKLSEKASSFLVVLCGRSSEGRKRVTDELVKALYSISNLENKSFVGRLLPDKKVISLADLVYSILSKNSSSGSLPGAGFSPDIAKSMIDGGMVQSLTSILRVLDLDHPDAPKLVDLVLKSLESLTRAANTSEQGSKKSDSVNKKKAVGSNGSPHDQTVTEATEALGLNQNQRNLQVTDGGESQEQHHQGMSQNRDDHEVAPNRFSEQNMRIEVEETMTDNHPIEHQIGFMHEDSEDRGVLHDGNQIEMTFHVDNRADNDMGDEDDDMDDDGDEDEDIAEDGNALMSLADTDGEDDDAGLGDEYNDDVVEDDDDDFPENRVIEVRWREALDGLDHLQVFGQPGARSGIFEVATEPFEGVNVDDLFGLRRSLGFERRRQTNRTSFERSVTEGSHFQHPLLSRPSQSGRDSVSIWSSSENSSRDLEPSAGRFDLGQFYMLDTPALPHDRASSSLFGERLDGGSAAAPTLSDFYFSAGLESLRMSGRRGPGDSRWTDFGQPQASGVASTIADTIEDQFISQLRGVLLVRNSGERLEVPLANNTQIPLTNDTNGGQQTNSQSHNDGVEVAHGEPDQILENVPHEEVNPEVIEVHGSSLSEMQAEDIGGVRGDSMDIEEGDETLHERVVVTDASSGRDSQPRNNALVTSGIDIPNPVDDPDACITRSLDVDMNSVPTEENQIGGDEPPLGENVLDVTRQAEQSGANEASNANAIDPTFLEALPEDLRAEVLAAQQARSAPPPTYEPPSAEDIDPEFLAALPPDIQAEVLAQQRAGRVAQQAEGQPVDMDNASIIATFPADLREEVLLTSSEAVLSALPSSLLAEAQMLRDRAMSHYQARSLFGSSHRINGRRNGLGFDRQTGMDRGGVTIGRRASSSLGEGLKLNEMEGELLLDSHALIALVRLLRLAQPLGKGLLQRLLLNLCAHSVTRATLIWLLLDMIKPETQTAVSKLKTVNAQRLYGCQSNVVYGRSQLLDGLPPLVLRSVLEILTYLATNHSAVANILFHFDSSLIPDFSTLIYPRSNNGKGKEKIVEEGDSSKFAGNSQIGDIPLILLLKLLSRPHFLRSSAQFEQVMGVIQVVVFAAAAKLESQPCSTTNSQNIARNVTVDGIEKEMHVTEGEPDEGVKRAGIESSTSDGKSNISVSDIFLQLPRADLRNVCSLLGHEGLSDKVYLLAGEVLKKLASVATPHRKHFMLELSELANSLSNSAVSELVTLRNTHMLGLSSGSMAGHGVLRVIQILCSLASPVVDGGESDGEMEEHSIMSKLSVALEPLWQELSNCISSTETDLAQSSVSSIMTNTDVQEHAPGSSSSSPPLPPGTQRLLPFIEAFFVLCEKIQAINYVMQNDYADTTAREVKESAGTSAPSPTRVGVDSHKRIDGAVIFAKFAEKHRRLLNAFVRQNPGLLEKSLSVMLKAPRLIDFDNKKAYFRSRIRQHHDQHLSGPLRISVRRAYVLEDSYNQLRMRPTQDMKGRLNVHFQGEEGIDAGGLTREWYQLLSRVIFDKGALLFTTVGNNATFQPNPNSVFQTEHLSYFKFVGRVVAKALFDAQLLDVYFTRSFYKHILGVKVTYHDIEAVDPDYYKNLKWMLENDVSDILDLTFSMDADEEKHILYEKTEVTDYELKPGGRNIRVTEETKHEYVDLVADHILTNAIRPQINSFLEGFNELVPGELISIFNDKELELLISGLPEIDVDDLKANTVYTGYSAASSVIQWFWEVVEAFNKEDMARFLQFVTGTSKFSVLMNECATVFVQRQETFDFRNIGFLYSRLTMKVPLEGFKALQGISGPQRFQIHKAYGAPERLPSAHTCFNQLDLPEYPSKEQLQDRLLLAIHEASEGFGFG